MEGKKIKRTCYSTTRQRKKLVQFMAKHPQLVAWKSSQVSMRDSHNLWQTLTKELNSIPGARKTWQQWRKTWLDLRSRTRRTKNFHFEGVDTLTLEEQKVLGIHSAPSNKYNESEVYLQGEDTDGHNYNQNADNYSDQESASELKVFASTPRIPESKDTGHSNECHFNCELLAAQEQKKIQMKEDYFNFKKEYLKEKLDVMKQQVEALKSIARGLIKE